MNKRRILALVLACVLCVCIGIGGTLAWLTANTAPVVNTFTVGDINITLTETGTDTHGNKNYPFVPGDELSKDPKVTVAKDSEACWLFVHVDVANNNVTVDNDTITVINWSIANGWTEVSGHDGYYYRKVDATTTDAATFDVLANNKVTVSTEVTKAMVDGLTTSKPTITVTAAAVQKDNVSETAAWAKLPTSFTNPTTTP